MEVLVPDKFLEIRVTEEATRNPLPRPGLTLTVGRTGSVMLWPLWPNIAQ